MLRRSALAGLTRYRLPISSLQEHSSICKATPVSVGELAAIEPRRPRADLAKNGPLHPTEFLLASGRKWVEPTIGVPGTTGIGRRGVIVPAGGNGPLSIQSGKSFSPRQQLLHRGVDELRVF